jgi:hypothetical protein
MNSSPGRHEDQNHPIFIASSGRRRRLVRYVAVTVGCACLGYLAVFVVVFGGLEEPVNKHSPSVERPLPSSSHDDSDVPAGAHFPAKSKSPSSSPDNGTNPSTAPTSPATSSARPGGTNQ